MQRAINLYYCQSQLLHLTTLIDKKQFSLVLLNKHVNQIRTEKTNQLIHNVGNSMLSEVQNTAL